MSPWLVRLGNHFLRKSTLNIKLLVIIIIIIIIIRKCLFFESNIRKLNMVAAGGMRSNNPILVISAVTPLNHY